MPILHDTSTTAANSALAIAPAFGWRSAALGGGEAWFKGYMLMDGSLLEGEAAAAYFAALLDRAATPESIAKELLGIDGQFAAAISKGGRLLATVDRTRSIPLFYAKSRDGWLIGDVAPALRTRCGLAEADLDAGLEIAMAGYALGRGTLYQGLNQLQAGEMLLIEGQGTPQLRRWYLYRPWRVAQGPTKADWLDGLARTTERIFEKLVNSLAGRPVMLPLSAGLDSRLVVSGLHRLGYRDVHVYSYGQAGNHEASIARLVADRLGYRWTFVPFTQTSVRASEASDDWRRYLEVADSLASVPFKQDFQAVQALRRQGVVPRDAVFINGNSGDFISGNHIPAVLHGLDQSAPSDSRKRRILDALLTKHFSLWRDLRTPANDDRIRQSICAAWARDGVPETSASGDHGIYEHTEFQERQAKFVISGQRVYEFFGHGWRLPLWDNDYLDFWEQVPLEFKIRQNLYNAFLVERNWAGVWYDIPISPARTIVPRWSAAARLAAKAVFAPLGKKTWRSIDRRAFAYWTDTLANYATTPYWRVLRAGRGHRNAMSWRCSAYLASHRRDPRGLPLDV